MFVLKDKAYAIREALIENGLLSDDNISQVTTVIEQALRDRGAFRIVEDQFNTLKTIVQVEGESGNKIGEQG